MTAKLCGEERGLWNWEGLTSKPGLYFLAEGPRAGHVTSLNLSVK